MSDIYSFSNGIHLRRSDLTAMQLARYSAPGNPNLHEPVEEEWVLRCFAQDVTAGAVFLDVGAGVGYYSLLVKKRWPEARVIAIEALPRHADALEFNLALNGLMAGDIELIRAAVGPTRGEASFVDLDYGSKLSAGEPGQTILKVPVRTLGELLATLPPVHLMKMDIQGTELAVLKAARKLLARGQVRQVAIGTHGQRLHKEIGQLLARTDFTIMLDDPAPLMQPDGLLVAGHSADSAGIGRWMGTKIAAMIGKFFP